jgi:HlyD family secretion protein
MSLVSELWSILTVSQRRRVLGAQAISVAMACSTVTGIVAIAPFFAVIGDPRLIDRNAVLHALYVYGNFSDKRVFIIALGVGFVAVVLVANLINALGFQALNRMALRIGSELQTSLFREYLGRPYVFHAATDSTTLSNNIVHETARITNGILQNGLLLITNLVTALFIVLSVLLIDPSLAITMILVLGGGYGLIYLCVRGRLLRLGHTHSRTWWERAKIITESFGAIREILLLRDRSAFQDAFERKSVEVAHTRAQVQVFGQVPKYVMECVAVSALVAAALVPGTHDGGMGSWLGELTFMAFAAYRLLPTLQQVFAATVLIRSDRAALTLIAPDLRQARVAQAPLPAPAALRDDSWWLRRPHEEICLKDVSFCYSPERALALDNINLRIPACAIIGIIGANGSGKTTLMDLIAGLLTPTTGELQVDGVAVDQSNRPDWQARIAYVPQSIFLLDSTIAHNIAFGSEAGAIDGARLAEAARCAQLEGFIASLPQGYDHQVGERGVKLSGGQRQRIGIARALYKGASVLLLDEAMSALDGLTEDELITALGALRGSCTIILIAHRPGMLSWCDTIYQLENGRISASGSPDDLTRQSERLRRTIGVR